MKLTATKDCFVALLIIALPLCTACSQEVLSSEDFEMTILDRFSIAGGGVVVTGVIASGTVSVDDTLCLVSATGVKIEVTVTGIERFKDILDSAGKGDRVGLLISGVDKDDVVAEDRLIANCS
jgi:translation elongation factor EF-Tu-like GTPase